MRIEVIASGSTGNCYWVSDGQTHLLLDCGIRRPVIATEMHTRGLPGIDAVLVTHEHQDHSKAVKPFLGLGYDVYMGKGTSEALGLLYGQDRTVQAGVQRAIGTWLVSPFAIEHDAAEPLGFRLFSGATHEALLYATDTQYVAPRHGDGCAVLMLEANYDLDRIRENVAAGEIDAARKHRALWQHQSIDTVLKFLRETDRGRLQAVYLLHLSDANSDEDEFKRRVAEIAGCPVIIA